MKRRLIAMILLGMFLSKTCLADGNVTQIGRYLTVSNKPKISQIDLLSQTVQVRFPQNIQSIGDAMNYLLRFSGYSLASPAHTNSALKITLSKPLPIIDRELGPVSLKEGLVTLSGPAFYLVENPVNRIVDFELKPTYKKFMKNKITYRG
jgi:conjugative transfer region protein (TIGR03748 family)